MRKEIVFAIIFGIIFSAVVAFGFFRANSAIKETASEVIEELSSHEEEDDQKPAVNLTLLKPQNRQIAMTNPLNFTGLTRQNSYILITNGTSDTFTKTDDGSFDVEFELEPSHNFVRVVSLDEDNNSQQSDMELVYSSEFQKQIVPDEERSVDERFEDAKSQYTFFKGTVTEITDGSVQIKSDDQEIKYLSVNEDDTSFVKLDKTSETLKYSDLAIGDYIIALGSLNENQVLTTQRVLVTTSEAKKDISLLKGTVTDIQKTTLTLKNYDDTEVELFDTKSSSYTDGDINDPDKAKFSYIDPGSEIVASVEESADEQLIRKLHILSYPEDEEE